MIEHLRSLPKQGHPMKWFLAAINVMGMYEGTGDYSKDCLNVIAQLPEAVAAIFRIRSGWGDPIPSKPELGYMENFVHMLGAPGAKPDLVRLMSVFDILHFDHGGGNLSTFVGKAIASGHEDMYGSLVGAMAALAGPLHGMANQECLRFLKEIAKDVKDPDRREGRRAPMSRPCWPRAACCTASAMRCCASRIRAPRCNTRLGETIAPKDPLFRLSATLRKVGSEILKKKGKAADPYPNVDAVSGCLLTACGLTDENYYTVLFGMARCVGIAAQIVYERKEARGGKGTPIVRPKYLYTGPVRG